MTQPSTKGWARPSVYHYRDPVLFLRDYFHHLKATNDSFSMRKWAAAMELKSPRLLVAILHRERPLKLRILAVLRKGLTLDSTEDLYLRALVQRASVVDAEEGQLLDLVLADLASRQDSHSKVVEACGLFSHWLHAAILAMAEVEDIPASAEELSRRFRWKVDLREVESAVSLLLQLGLLHQGDAPGRLRASHSRVTSPNDVRLEAVHGYYRQVHALADEAVALPVDQREYQCFALALGEEDLPVMKELLRSSRRRIETAAEGRGTLVFQVNLEMFPVTHSWNARPSQDDRRGEVTSELGNGIQAPAGP